MPLKQIDKNVARRRWLVDFQPRPMPPSSDELRAAWKPSIEECIQGFGPSRCMFESNFPVDRTMCSYPALWNAFKKSCIGYSNTEKRLMLGGTAKQVYKIELYASEFGAAEPAAKAADQRSETSAIP